MAVKKDVVILVALLVLLTAGIAGLVFGGLGFYNKESGNSRFENLKQPSSEQNHSIFIYNHNGHQVVNGTIAGSEVKLVLETIHVHHIANNMSIIASKPLHSDVVPQKEKAHEHHHTHKLIMKGPRQGANISDTHGKHATHTKVKGHKNMGGVHAKNFTVKHHHVHRKPVVQHGIQPHQSNASAMSHAKI